MLKAHTMIYLIGIILPLFLSLLLLGKKGKTQADLVLLLWLLTIAVHLLLYYLQSSGLHLQYPFLLGWQFPLPFLQWTFMYLYISALTSKERLPREYLFHFVPFLFSVFLFFNYYFLPGPDKVEIFKTEGKGFETQMAINSSAIIISGLVYIILSMIKLIHHRKSIKNRFSHSEKINLTWLQYIVTGMVFIFSMILFNIDDDYIFTPVVCFVVFIGYYGIKQVGIFSQYPPAVYHENNILPGSNRQDEKAGTTAVLKSAEEMPEKDVPGDDVVKYQKSTLDEETASKIYADLKRVMQADQCYKNPELSLDELANILAVLPNHLSQVINSKEKRNFYDYINQLRIEHFIAILSLPDNKKFTLLSLAYEAGFNSKTSFNRNFKKATGLTPSQYVENEKIKMEGQSQVSKQA